MIIFEKFQVHYTKFSKHQNILTESFNTDQCTYIAPKHKWTKRLLRAPVATRGPQEYMKWQLDFDLGFLFVIYYVSAQWWQCKNAMLNN